MFCVFLWEWLWIKMVQILLNLSGFQLWSDYPESLLLRQNNTSKTDPRHRCVTHNLPRNKILSQTHFNIYRIETEIWENIGEYIIWKNISFIDEHLFLTHWKHSFQRQIVKQYYICSFEFLFSCLKWWVLKLCWYFGDKLDTVQYNVINIFQNCEEMFV